MVVLIRRLLFPLIRRFRRLFFSMIAVSCLGIALMTGLGSAYSSLQVGFDNYIERYGYADISLTVARAPKNICKLLKKLEGVTQVDGRMVDDFTLDAGGYMLTARVFTFEPDSAQDFYVRESSAKESSLPKLYADAIFAEANGIKAGDDVKLKINDEFKSFHVQNIVSTPEALSVEQNAYFWGSNSDFGYVYLPTEHMKYVFGSDEFCRQFLLQIDDDADSERVLDAAKKILEPYQLLDSYCYEDSPVNKRIQVNLEPLNALSFLLPPLFFAVMLLVMLLFLMQIIQQCRKDIGILRTFGFTRGQISALFFALCFCVTMPAAFLGIGCGRLLLEFASGLYARAFMIPPVETQLQWQSCTIAVILTVLTGQLAAAVGCRQLVRIRPSEALRRKTVSALSPAALNILPKKLPPIMKLSAAVVIRNGMRFVLSVVCIAASMMLIVSALSFERSKNFILEQLFENRIAYDCQIYLDEYPNDALLDELNSLNGVSQCERLFYLSANLVFDGKEEEVLINAPETDTILVRVPDVQFHSINIPQSGIVLEKHIAERMGINVGDEVTVNGQSVAVCGLSNQSVSRVQYVSQETIRSFGKSEYSLLCACDDEGVLRTFVEKMEGCQAAVFTRLIRQDRLRSFKSYSIGVWIIICFAVAMSLMIVHNRMKSNLLEQQHELATMRILGIYRGEISFAWLLQSLLQFILAAAVGIPAGAASARLILQQMSTVKREYPFANRAEEYLLSALILLLFILLGHFLSMLQLKRWNLAENSKTTE